MLKQPRVTPPGSLAGLLYAPCVGKRAVPSSRVAAPSKVSRGATVRSLGAVDLPPVVYERYPGAAATPLPAAHLGSGVPEHEPRKHYYHSDVIRALVCLRNFSVHGVKELAVDRPSKRYGNVGEVFMRYLPAGRRFPNDPSDFARIFEGLMQETCTEVETLGQALNEAAARGEL